MTKGSSSRTCGQGLRFGLLHITPKGESPSCLLCLLLCATGSRSQQRNEQASWRLLDERSFAMMIHGRAGAAPGLLLELDPPGWCAPRCAPCTHVQHAAESDASCSSASTQRHVMNAGCCPSQIVSFKVELSHMQAGHPIVDKRGVRQRRGGERRRPPDIGLEGGVARLGGGDASSLPALTRLIPVTACCFLLPDRLTPPAMRQDEAQCPQTPDHTHAQYQPVQHMRCCSSRKHTSNQHQLFITEIK